MKNFWHKLSLCLVSVTFGFFLVLPCCRIAYALNSFNDHSCCSKNLTDNPIDSSSHQCPIHCPKDKDILQVENGGNSQFITHIHSRYDQCLASLNTFSPRAPALSAFTGSPRNKQNSIPLYLQYSILRI
ncbi:MAG TPA: hypothetical protein VJA17_05105 [Candidatus Omnitrophota bacterium]|nr:hypothetical protein [Candidatus Omnitrophota bacterium]